MKFTLATLFSLFASVQGGKRVHQTPRELRGMSGKSGKSGMYPTEMMYPTSRFGEIVPVSRAFFVWSDDYESTFTIRNGQIVYAITEDNDGDELDLDDTGVCTLDTCSSAWVRAVVKGERVEGGDLLILDFGWEGADNFHVQCPEQWQTPSVEFLGCKSGPSENIDCAPETCTPLDAIAGLCFDRFYFSFDAIDEANPANTVLVNHNNPSDDYIVIRFAVFCADPVFEFKESIHSPSTGDES